MANVISWYLFGRVFGVLETPEDSKYRRNGAIGYLVCNFVGIAGCITKGLQPSPSYNVFSTYWALFAVTVCVPEALYTMLYGWRLCARIEQCAVPASLKSDSSSHKEDTKKRLESHYVQQFSFVTIIDYCGGAAIFVDLRIWCNFEVLIMLPIYYFAMKRCILHFRGYKSHNEKPSYMISAHQRIPIIP